MAAVLSNFPAALLVHRAQALSGGAAGIAPFSNVSSSRGRRNSIAIVVKATSDSSESSTSLDIVKSVQDVWENSEDRVAIIGLGFAAVIGVWASANVVTAIDKLPIIPSFLELVGILYSSWFIYRYLLFKPDREELFQSLNKSISSILGQ